MKMYSGKNYLYIHIANTYGKDKDLFEDRIDWVAANERNLEQMIREADEPRQMDTAVRTLRKAQQGLSTGSMCALDAINSGSQIMSALMGCKTGAEATGLVDTGERPDAYQLLQDVMNQVLTDQGITVEVSRQHLKDAFMKWLYGSSMEPKIIFGIETPQYYAFFKAMKKIVPGAVMLRDVLIKCFNSYQLIHEYTLDDGFRVVLPTTVKKKYEMKIPSWEGVQYNLIFDKVEAIEHSVFLAANVIHSLDGLIVREMCRRCNYDLDKVAAVYKYLCRMTKGAPVVCRKKFVSLNLIDKLDGLDMNTMCRLRDLCADVLRWDSSPLVAVHDSFKAHFNQMNKVRYWYKELLAEFAESDMLERILFQLTGQELHIPRECTNLADYIRKSNYCLS